MAQTSISRISDVPSRLGLKAPDWGRLLGARPRGDGSQAVSRLSPGPSRSPELEPELVEQGTHCG
jgi:hypothetical protein